MKSVNAVITEVLSTNTTSTALNDFRSVSPTFAVSPNAFKRFTFVVTIILSPTISVLGLVGNTVGLIVLNKDKSRRNMSIYTYLLGMMISDTALLIAGFSTTVSETIGLFQKNLGNLLRSYLLIFGGYVNILLKEMSSVMLIIMSIERFLSLVRPFTVKNTFVSKHPKTIICLVFLFSTIYIIPFYIGFRITSFQDHLNNTDYRAMVLPEYYDLFEAYTYVETLLLHYVCPVLVLCFNLLIVITLSRLRKRSVLTVNNSVLNDNQTKITIVVLCIAAFYLILSLPSVFIQTLIFIEPKYGFDGPYNLTFFVFIRLGDFLARVNAATDFFMYIIVSSYYRMLFSSMIGKNRLTAKSNTSTVGTRLSNKMNVSSFSR